MGDLGEWDLVTEGNLLCLVDFEVMGTVYFRRVELDLGASGEERERPTAFLTDESRR